MIYAVLLLMAVTLSRASFRLVGEFMQRQRQSGRRVVIYGAGDAAGSSMRELLSRRRRRAHRRLHRRRSAEGRHPRDGLSGARRLFGADRAVKAASVDAVVISARTLPPERLNNLQVLCADANVGLTRLRVGLESLVDGDGAPTDLPERTGLRQFRS